MRHKRVQIIAVSGNALEFYDFMVYSFFATYIGANFFPLSSSMSGLLNALAIFGVGFAARPIGAVILGLYADYHGRRPAMILTMALMTAATSAIAVLPTYKQIGVLAPILLMLCRLIQGFALGGEVGPATAYLLETASPGQTGLMCSWFFAGQGAAMFVAGVTGTVVTLSLSPNQMTEWGWRLPFLVSVILAPLALYLRRRMPETAAPRHGDLVEERLCHFHGVRGWNILLLTIALMGGTVANYMCSYLTTFAITTLSLPASTALSATIVVGAATLLGGLTGGWLSDQIGNRPVLLWSRFTCTLLALPAFVILTRYPSAGCLWSIAALLSICNGMNGGALFATIAGSFSRRHRAAGMSLVYACGVALFGGASQFVVTGLIDATGITAMPGLYMLVTGTLAFVALLAVSKTKEQNELASAKAIWR